MEDFTLLEERSYFMEFSHDSSIDDYLQEVSFSTKHFCAIVISETSITQGELDALSQIDGDFGRLWPQMEEAYRKSMKGDCENELMNLGCDGGEKGTKLQRRRGGGADKKVLTFEEVSRHFSMPIKQAARELNVGLTVLKKQCRELGFPRWPHRKVKSLQTLINNVQELGKKTEDRTWTVVVKLQQTKKMIEESPTMLLDEKTKVLRQACFKENFKRRRLMKDHGICSGMALLANANH